MKIFSLFICVYEADTYTHTEGEREIKEEERQRSTARGKDNAIKKDS